MKLFFCFSSKDRHSVVESILYHLDNYCIPVWYDRREMLMGDQRNHKNFVEGVGNCNYAIIVLSPNSIISKCANEEIDLIKEKYEKCQMVVFPIFYNINIEPLQEKYLWMTKLVYKELADGIDTISICNHIVCKILLDELSKYPIRSLSDYTVKYKQVQMHSFLVSIIKSYLEIYVGNYNARLSMLFAAYIYLTLHYETNGFPPYYYKGVQHLFNHTKLSLPTEKREMLIMERSILLMINSIMFGTFI